MLGATEGLRAVDGVLNGNEACWAPALCFRRRPADRAFRQLHVPRRNRERARIVEVRCSDPPNCFPARPAPAKQLDFDAIGTFKNMTTSGRALRTPGSGSVKTSEVLA